jgi:hypothetical protein
MLDWKLKCCRRCACGTWLPVDYTVNELMRSTWDAVHDQLDSISPRPDLQRLIRKGLMRESGRIYLRAYARRRRQTAARMDQWSAERWLNDVHLESARPASDPAWRADVLGQAVTFVRQILPGFAALAAGPVQAVIGLQSAPGRADQETDVPVGSVHLYQLCDPGDDARTRVESFGQPMLVITCGESG